jgi:peptide/nickel transport system ATP-binding protein
LTPLLSIEELRVETSEARIVDGVSVAIEPGEVVALIGESGAGKTTIGLAALGYFRPGCRPTGGRVLLEGEDLLRLGADERRAIRGRRVAYVAQSAAAAFNPALTVGRQVEEVRRLHGIAGPPSAEIFRLLDLPSPSSIGARYPHELSGGQLQRLMLAMAMSCRPQLLVLDEPTTALDVTTQIEVLAAIQGIIREHGTAALYVSHDIAVVVQIAQRILVLRDGRKMEEGHTEDIVERPRTAYTAELLNARRRTAPQSRPSMAAPLLLEVDRVSAGYASGPAVLHEVSLQIPRGAVLAVIGESGSGKSTLARVLAGLLAPQAGTARLGGEPLAGLASGRSREAVRRIQIVFQAPDTSLNPRQRVQTIIARPLELFHGLRGAAQRRRVAELLELVELPSGFASRLPGELSGGEKQRVAIARALAARPDLLLCDEITASLDSVVAATVLDLLMRLQRELGVSDLYISHDVATVASIADEIVVLYAGVVVEKGPASALLTAPAHPYTRLLVSSVPEPRSSWLEDVLQKRLSLSEAAAGRGPCAFFGRCVEAIAGVCDRDPPPWRTPAPGRSALCHRAPSFQ